jgi:general secretion pathway protein G
MKWFYNRIYKKDKGFTLVELMVVIIILAVLTGIAIPSYLALRNRARIQATRSEMTNIGTALEMYNADYEDYPALADYPGHLTGGGPDAIIYMAIVPADDAWGNAYVYALPVGGGYTLTSWGPDEAAGGGDDIIMTNGTLN